MYIQTMKKKEKETAVRYVTIEFGCIFHIIGIWTDTHQQQLSEYLASMIKRNGKEKTDKSCDARILKRAIMCGWQQFNLICVCMWFSLILAKRIFAYVTIDSKAQCGMRVCICCVHVYLGPTEIKMRDDSYFMHLLNLFSGRALDCLIKIDFNFL